jgi:glycosyltransferase involved in cell wall biosynthesis
MKKMLPVSVVIPIKGDEEGAIDRLSKAIYNQTAWPREIILVNANKESKDSSCTRFGQGFDNLVEIKILLASNAFPGRARNVGIANASQLMIAFLDLMTIPNPTWLEKSFELISQNSYDGLIGKCNFIGGNFFSWIVIDSLFGRGPVPSFPGSLFTIEGLKKVGPMLDKTRSGEDNEWLQRANLMEVDFAHFSTVASCSYLGFQNINFSKFCQKWIRNYWTAANLPQYKLISQFNILAWFFIAAGLALNWNAFFAEWDTYHPLYLPHISKVIFANFLLAYFLYRVIYLPIKRGSELKQILSYRIFFIFFTALLADSIKSVAFLAGALRSRH